MMNIKNRFFSIKNRSLRMVFYILICLTISCNTNKESIEIKDYFSKLTSNNELIANIDYSKNESMLIKVVENQLDIDLCSDGSLIAQTLIYNTNIQYPIFVIKNCEDFISIHGLISILINDKNEALVNDEFVNADTDLSEKVFKATKEMMSRKGRNHLLYSFDWNEKSKPDNIKIKLYQTLKGIKKYADSSSFAHYNKPANALNRNQFDSLKMKFNVRIGFNDYFERFPLPPKI